jgi:hypothetical protein
MSSLPEPVSPQQIRISDADRERVAKLLRDAAADGRLDLPELDERLGAVYSARTFGDLVPITGDLVTGDATAAQTYREPSAEELAATRSSWAVAVMSGFQRKGRWTVPRVVKALAFWGGGSLDLREARFSANVVRIRAVAVMGGIEVIVPEGADVHVTGLGLMGGFDHSASGSGHRPGAPTIVVSGFAFWGGVSVSRKPLGEHPEICD